MKELGHHDGVVDAIHPLGDGWLSAGRDGTLRRWPEGERVHRCDPGDFITCLTDGWAGTMHSRVLRLDASGAVTDRFEAMEMGIADVAAAPDGGVFVCGDDNRVEHRAADGSPIWVAETYKFPYALAAGGSTLFIATWDAYLYAVDLDVPPSGSPEEPTELPYPAHPPGPMPFYDVAVLSDGRVAVASHGEEGEATLHVWRHGDTDAAWQAALGPLHALAFHPGRDRVAAGGASGVVHLRGSDGSEHGAIPLPAGGALTGDAWYPAVAEFDTLASANAVTAVAFDGTGAALLVGTAAGAILQLPVAD